MESVSSAAKSRTRKTSSTWLLSRLRVFFSVRPFSLDDSFVLRAFIYALVNSTLMGVRMPNADPTNNDFILNIP